MKNNTEILTELKNMHDTCQANGDDGFACIFTLEEARTVIKALDLLQPIRDCQENKAAKRPCASCDHEDICTYCAEHLDGFTLPKETCELYKPKIKGNFDSPLADTIENMISDDYKERFRAEYLQTKIRYERLKAFNTIIEAADISALTVKAVKMPKHDVPLSLLLDQQRRMGEYLHILEVRAVIEGIDLNNFDGRTK